jgi:3-oxoacyl-[acyl-carrier protein] reductase
MTSLKNKVALITGSTSGLGKAIAERYATLGADIVINYPKDRASADEVLSNIKATGANAIALPADISRVAELNRMFEEAKRTFGKIDIVVANAGIEMVEVPVTDFTEEQFDKVFAINTRGTYFTLQQAARHVSDNGRIIYIASSTTSFPMPGMGVYGRQQNDPALPGQCIVTGNRAPRRNR